MAIPATFDRTTIVRGPCRITYDGATFFSKGGVALAMSNETFDKETDAYGVVGRAKTDLKVTVSFEPVGEIEAIATLFPYASTVFGASIYGSTDKPLVIVSSDATYTILAAAITKLPTIKCSANSTAIGSVEFTGLLKKGGDPSLAADYFTYSATGGTVQAVGFDPSTIVTAPYSATLGSLSFMSEAGFEISFDAKMNPVKVDGIGTVDMSFQGIGFTVTCIPTGVADTSFDTYFGSLSAGEELAAVTLDISTPTSKGLNFDSTSVQIMDLQRRFSPNDNRLGQLTLKSKRAVTSGIASAIYTLTVVA
jgi:hypothetical protein